jgi:hypothetical protein
MKLALGFSLAPAQVKNLCHQILFYDLGPPEKIRGEVSIPEKLLQNLFFCHPEQSEGSITY